MKKQWKKSKEKSKNEKGQILIISFIFMITILSITVAFIFMTSARSRNFAHQVMDIKAFWLAEAGVEEALYQLSAPDYDSYRANPSTINGEMGSGTYEVLCTADGNNFYTVTSTGTVKEMDRTIEIYLEVLYGFPPPGFTAKTSIHVSGKGEIDAYNSADGEYVPPSPGEEMKAEIGCNGIIDLSGQGYISGDIQAGGDIGIVGQAGIKGDVESGGLISGQDLITEGSIIENADPPPQPFDESIIDLVDAEVEYAMSNNNNNQLLDPLDPNDPTTIPTYLINDTEFSISVAEVYEMPGGIYYFTKFSILGTLELKDGDSVIIYYDGSDNINVAGQGVINSSDNVANFTIISRSSGNINVEGQADFSGIIIAPLSTAEYTGGADFYGGILADQVLLSGLGEVHCDLNSDIEPTTHYPTGLDIISWGEK